MKKIFIFALLCALTLLFCGCSNNNSKLNNRYVTVEKIEGGFLGETLEYLYDVNTKIVYLYTFGGYHATMCPYYIIVNGKVEHAIYGVNYIPGEN